MVTGNGCVSDAISTLEEEEEVEEVDIDLMPSNGFNEEEIEVEVETEIEIETETETVMLSIPSENYYAVHRSRALERARHYYYQVSTENAYAEQERANEETARYAARMTITRPHRMCRSLVCLSMMSLIFFMMAFAYPVCQKKTREGSNDQEKAEREKCVLLMFGSTFLGLLILLIVEIGLYFSEKYFLRRIERHNRPTSDQH